MFELLDSVFDELAKRIKESPGWVSLFVGIQVALRSTWIQAAAQTLDLEISKERSTIAALIAVALLSLGDILDTAVFPRDKDPQHDRTILSNSILALASLGYLWLVVRIESRWALLGFAAVILWVLFVLFLGALPQLFRVNKLGEIGWPMLKIETLKTAQERARAKLQIQKGIYGVSLGLARKAGQYKWGHRLWLENELGKLFRSLVLPFVGLSLIALIAARPLDASLAVAGAFLAFGLYWRLKVAHMCGLYNVAQRLVHDDDYRPKPAAMANGKRAFFWGEKLAGSEP